jgi:hypothetical protein
VGRGTGDVVKRIIVAVLVVPGLLIAR